VHAQAPAPTGEHGSGCSGALLTAPLRGMQGRFLAIAGFGNLPGDVALYDRKPDGKFKPMGSVRCGLHATGARVLASLGPAHTLAGVRAALPV